MDWNSFTSILVGGSLTLGGSWFMFRIQRRSSFYETQLKELYGPIRTLLWKIQAETQQRNRILEAGGKAWNNVVNAQVDRLPREQPNFEPYKKMLEDQNDRYEEVIRPLYRQIETILVEKSWLVTEETKNFFLKLYQYNNGQDLILQKRIPGEVYQDIEIKEEELQPFYDHIICTVEILQKKIR
jgi:hypothetical protein